MNIFYYSESGKIYINRLDAIASPDPCYVYYDDREFSKVDWSIEPQETFKELYRQQAQRIRDNYEYVVLAYSGGVDSTNMIESFYYNNIHIDEIYVVGALSQDSEKGSDENHNGELYKNVFPTLDKFHLPRTKINIQDYSKYFDKPEQISAINKNKTEWFKELGSYYSPHIWFWNETYKHINYRGKRAALVFGIDKPNFYYNNGNSYFNFHDANLMCYIQNSENLDRVNFYWDSGFPDILRKQMHVIKNIIDNRKNDDILQTFIVDKYAVIEKIIYNLNNPLSFKSEKTKSNIISPRDRFILKKKNSTLFEYYSKGIIELQKTIPKTNLYTTIPPFVSRNYYLG